MAGLDLSISGRAKSLLSPRPNMSDMDMDISPSKSSDSPVSTPRKNKRKSSSPKRRSDFSIKRFCPDTPHALNLETEDGSGRPGYGEHPPSTPETSASSSTPSPPDATELRIPQVQRHQGMTSPHLQMTSSPPRSAASPVMENTIHGQQRFMPPYALAAPFMQVNPLLIQHMVALQQQGALPSVIHQQMAAATQLHHVHPHAPAAHTGAHAQLHAQPHTHSSHTSQTTQPASSAQSSSSKASMNPVTVARSRTPPLCAETRNLSTSRISNDSINLSASRTSDPSFHSDNEDDGDFEGGKRRKNYKNMTRERRIEANARERSRVHTISAAFETLRRSVPSFSHNQRLSKLAILRIACSYIMSLASLAGHDYSWGRDPMSFEESVDQCTKTIQNEGRAKRRH